MHGIVPIWPIFLTIFIEISATEDILSNHDKVVITKAPTLCCHQNSVLVNDHCEKETSGSTIDFDSIIDPNSYVLPLDSDPLNETVNELETNLYPTKTSYTGGIGIPLCQNGAFNVIIPQKDIRENFDKGNFRYDGAVYLPGEYCIGRVQDEKESIAIRLCNISLISCGKGRLCFPKCCKWDEIVEVSPGSQNYSEYQAMGPNCVKHDHGGNDYSWKPPIYENPDRIMDKNRMESLTLHYQTVGFPACDYMILRNDANVWFRILQEGTVKIGLQLTYRPVWLSVSSQDFCIDVLQSQVNNATANNAKTNYSQILFFCSAENFDLYILQRKLYGSLYLLSAVLLLTVLIINYALWSTHKLSGWTIISLFTAMFFIYLAFGIDFLTTADGLHAKRSKYCFLKGLLLQFFYLAYGSTWVIVNYDMFRSFRNLYQQMEMWTNRTRLVLYLIFSWVIPALMVIGGTTLYFLLNGLPENARGFYEYAYMSCYSPIFKQTLIYQMILVILNVIFFMLTTILICKHRRSVRMATLNSNCAFGDSFKLFLKLSVLSGVFFIPLIILDAVFSKAQTISWFWFVFRANHFIADLFILRAFGFNNKNIEALRRKYPFFNNVMVRLKPLRSQKSISDHNLAVIAASHRGSQSISASSACSLTTTIH